MKIKMKRKEKYQTLGAKCRVSYFCFYFTSVLVTIAFPNEVLYTGQYKVLQLKLDLESRKKGEAILPFN